VTLLRCFVWFFTAPFLFIESSTPCSSGTTVGVRQGKD
jgi:hypothetical protein